MAIRLSKAAARKLLGRESKPATRPRDCRPLRLFRPGRVLAAVEVAGRPVPWRAPIHGKGRSWTPAHVKVWKQTVARAVHEAGYGEAAGVPPYSGPVRVEVYVCRECPRGKRPGDVWAARPDIDNLFKGLGDSISGNVFKKKTRDPHTGESLPARLAPPSPVGRVLADDNQIIEVHITKLYWTHALAWIRVVAVAPSAAGPFPFSS
jgi:Holliday junction resolvase RusA-like endonuclease